VNQDFSRIYPTSYGVWYETPGTATPLLSPQLEGGVDLPAQHF